MSGLCAGRVAIVTGAGQGLGRSYALALADHGAAVLVNDLGTERAEAVAAEIRACGGAAVADGSDVSDWEQARAMVASAVDAFGKLDALIGNAGILRDRMIVGMSEQEWDAVIAVHLKGTFAPLRWAAEHWRARAKAGEAVAGRIVTTTSSTGLYGNPGQANYAAAKAGIAMLTRTAARELERYGVTANAIAPAALTPMTAPYYDQLNAAARERLDPAWVAALVVWLASAESGAANGHTFEISGNGIGVADGWRPGATRAADRDPQRLGAIASELVAAHDLPLMVPELVALADGA